MKLSINERDAVFGNFIRDNFSYKTIEYKCDIVLQQAW